MTISTPVVNTASPVVYRGFSIKLDPPPIPTRDHDWVFVHPEYDGPGDPRCGTGSSVANCQRQIDEILEEFEF